jgi:transcriptional regulator with XRE-family HTH domain
MVAAVHPVGDLLREWRQRRRMSQLDLSLEADISTKHLSFLETGRSQPSRDMVLLLAEQLEIPLRERNVLLVAAGYAPVFAERPLQDPVLQQARKAVDLVLAGHEPYPALAVDRHWTLVAANAAVGRMIAGADASLLQPPVNVLRLSLHPKGLAPRIANLEEWRAHLFARLRRQIEVSADPVLSELLEELGAYPMASPHKPGRPAAGREFAGVLVPGSSSPIGACSPSSAPPPCSARPSTSPCRSWRSRHSFLPMPRRARSCAALLSRAHRRRLHEASAARCYRNLETRSASSRMTLALSEACVPVGSPLYMMRGFDQCGMRGQPPQPSL